MIEVKATEKHECGEHITVMESLSPEGLFLVTRCLKCHVFIKELIKLKGDWI